ncbi:DUF6301 family protein [Haloglycomyces albus]|uniref:DUF6301 family protein n=1 Tax=Haloglycomyces albus TaxID=526067 RepID=UPI00046C9918|nr:hypothetical protein [Haloglycomyces albus]
MLGTHRISDYQLVDLLRRARQTNFGRWTKSDLYGALNNLGWKPRSTEVDIGMWRAETGYETGQAIIDSFPAGMMSSTGAEFYSIEVMVLRSAERGRQGEQHRTQVFKEVLGQVMRELGRPEVRGGDGGPWVRWYRDGLVFELHLKRFHGGVMLRLLSPTDFEHLNTFSIGRGDVSGWSAFSQAWSHPSEPAVDDFDEFTDRLAVLMTDMSVDANIFGTTGTVILRTNDWSARYVLATINGQLHVEASSAVASSWRNAYAQLPALGYRAPAGAMPNWSRTYGKADRTNASQAAHMMVDALRAFGIIDLFDIVYEGFTKEGERMYLPVLGIGNGFNAY